jgi:hypothetical protein
MSIAGQPGAHGLLLYRGTATRRLPDFDRERQRRAVGDPLSGLLEVVSWVWPGYIRPCVTVWRTIAHFSSSGGGVP